MHNLRPAIHKNRRCPHYYSDLPLKEKLLNDALSQQCADKRVQAKIHNNLADCYEQKGNLESAITEYEKSIALDPELAAPYNRGDIYKKKGMDKEAEKYYRTGKQLTEKEDNLGKK